MSTPQTVLQGAPTNTTGAPVDPNRDFPPGSMLALPSPTTMPTPSKASPSTHFLLPVGNQDRANAPKPNLPPPRQSNARRIVRAIYHYLHFKFHHLYVSRVQRVLEIARLSEED